MGRPAGLLNRSDKVISLRVGVSDANRATATFSATKTLAGSVSWRALRTDGAPSSAVNSILTVTEADYPGDADYDSDNINTSP